MSKQYYECHINLETNEYYTKDYLESLSNKLKWKFSVIDGDPILGQGIKCYFTKHYKKEGNNEIDIINQVQNISTNLKELGIKVLRDKVELVIYDSKTVNY